MGKTWVYPESVTPYGIFRYIVKGRAEFCIDDKTIIVRENQIVYIPQGSRMSCKVCSETFEFYSIRFTTSVFYEGEDVLTEYYGIPRVLENEGEDIFFQEIYKWVRKDAYKRGGLRVLLPMRVQRPDGNQISEFLCEERRRKPFDRGLKSRSDQRSGNGWNPVLAGYL